MVGKMTNSDFFATCIASEAAAEIDEKIRKSTLDYHEIAFIIEREVKDELEKGGWKLVDRTAKSPASDVQVGTQEADEEV